MNVVYFSIYVGLFLLILLVFCNIQDTDAVHVLLDLYLSIFFEAAVSVFSFTFHSSLLLC